MVASDGDADADANDFFVNYEETTVDPGWSFIVGVGIACVLLNLMLPCLVTLGSRYERRRQKRLGGDGASRGEEEANEDAGQDSSRLQGSAEDSKRGGDSRRKTSKEQQSQSQVVIVDMKRVHSRDEDEEAGQAVEIDNASQSLYSCNSGSLQQNTSKPSSLRSRTMPTTAHPNDDSEGNYSVASSTRKSAVDTAGAFILGLADKVLIPPYPPGPGSDANLQSSAASIASGTSSLSGLLLGNRPRRRRGNRHSNAVLDRLEFSSSYSSNLRSGGSATHSSPHHDDTLSMRFGRRGKATTATEGGVGKAPPIISNKGSAMSRLDHDDVSFNDALDCYRPGRYVLPTEERSGEVDLCYGEHAWWKPSMISAGFDRLVGTAEWDEEVTEIMKLAVPYSLQAIMLGAFDILNLALLGQLVGSTEANAFIVITLLVEVTSTLNNGFYEALGTLLPHAIGAENLKLAGYYLNTSLTLYTLGSLPGAFLWSSGAARAATIWFGFDDGTAEIAQRYAYSYIVIAWLEGITECFGTFLTVTEHERFSTVMQLVNHILSSLAFLIPPLAGHADLPTIGVAQIIFGIFALLANVIIIKWNGWFEGYQDGLLSIPFSNISALKTSLKTSIPLGIAWLLTYGEWELLTIFAAYLGPAEVAAWGYLGYVWSLLEYFSDGIADGSEVRCSYHLGANNPQIARLSSYKSIYLGFVSSVCATAITFLLSENLVKWLTPDPTIQRLMLELFPLVGIGQIALTTGIMSWALVGAQGRYRLATTIQFVGSWGLTLPLSALFTYVLNINLQGLTAAMVLGYTLGGTGNTYVLIRSQWERIAAAIYAENAADDSSTDKSETAGSPANPESESGNSNQNLVQPSSLLGEQAFDSDDDSILNDNRPTKL